MYEIIILLKTKESDGTAETIKIEDLKNGKKIYRQLIKQWNKKKAISLPTHHLSVASDLVHSIFLR
jgi:hypothetical protein